MDLASSPLRCEDMVQAGRIAGLSEKECKVIISEVRDAVREWPKFAAEAEVMDEFVTKIGARLGV